MGRWGGDGGWTLMGQKIKHPSSMGHFRPSHGVKKKDLKVFSIFGCKLIWKTPYSIIFARNTKFYLFIQFLLHLCTKRVTFLLWNVYPPKFMTPPPTLSKALYSRWPPHAEKNLTPPSEFSKLTPTHARISCPRMIMLSAWRNIANQINSVEISRYIYHEIKCVRPEFSCKVQYLVIKT